MRQPVLTPLFLFQYLSLFHTGLCWFNVWPNTRDTQQTDAGVLIETDLTAVAEFVQPRCQLADQLSVIIAENVNCYQLLGDNTYVISCFLFAFYVVVEYLNTSMYFLPLYIMSYLSVQSDQLWLLFYNCKNYLKEVHCSMWCCILFSISEQSVHQLIGNGRHLRKKSSQKCQTFSDFSVVEKLIFVYLQI